MKAFRKALWLVLFHLFFVPQVIAASTVTVNNPPATAVIGESIVLSVTLSDFTPSSQYYAKFRIGPTSSSLNDGETLNGSSWYSDSSAYTNFPIINLDASGSASFSLTGRAKVTSAQSGTNIFTVRMALVSDTDNKKDSNEYGINLTPAPTPTPTNTPTPTPESTATPTPTPAPTATPTPASATATPTPAATVTKKPTATPTSTLKPTPTPEASPSGEVLGSETTPEPTPEPQPRRNFKPLIISLLFIGTGLVLLALLLVFQKPEVLQQILKLLKKKQPDDILGS